MMPSARSAFTPPTPSTSSWRMRVRTSPPYSREVSSRSCGLLPSTSQSSRYSGTRPTCISQTLASSPPSRVSIETVIGLPSAPMAGSIGRFSTLRVEILFLLIAVVVEVLLEIALIVEQADGHQRHAQAAGALDMVAREHAQAAGVNRHRFVHAELGREIGHRLGAQHARFARAPGRARVGQIFLEPAMGLVDAACRAPSRPPARPAARASSRASSTIGLWSSCRQRIGSRSRNRLTTSGCQLHHRFLASDRHLS